MNTTANYQTVACVKCHRRIEMLSPVDVSPVCSECEDLVKCLWCSKEFEWDESMPRFCNLCTVKLEFCQQAFNPFYYTYAGDCPDLIKSLELVLTNVEVEETLTNLEDKSS